MFPNPLKLVRCLSAFRVPHSMPIFMAACPVMATPLGVVMLVQSLGPIASPALYGFAEAGRGISWLPLLSRVKCVPLLPTYEADNTMCDGSSFWTLRFHCCMYGHNTLSGTEVGASANNEPPPAPMLP